MKRCPTRTTITRASSPMIPKLRPAKPMPSLSASWSGRWRKQVHDGEDNPHRIDDLLASVTADLLDGDPQLFRITASASSASCSNWCALIQSSRVGCCRNGFTSPFTSNRLDTYPGAARTGADRPGRRPAAWTTIQQCAGAAAPIPMMTAKKIAGSHSFHRKSSCCVIWSIWP